MSELPSNFVTAEAMKPTQELSFDRNIVFCGPSAPAGGTIQTGGSRRFNELYLNSIGAGYSVFLVSSILESLLCGPQKMVKGSCIIVFDERFLIVAALLKMRGARIVFCPRGNKLIHHEWVYSEKRLRAYKLVFSLLYRFCDHFIFQTNAQREEFEHLHDRRWQATVVPNNSNASWMKSLKFLRHQRRPKKIFTVGFIGSDSPRKGLDILLSAWKDVFRDHDAVRLLVAGNVSQCADLKGVQWMGTVEQLEDFYGQVDLVVIPSRYDSFPNVMLEAACSGVPFIVGRTTITTEICGDQRELLCELEYKALKARLSQIISSVTAFELLKKEVEQFSERYEFDWGQEMLRAALGPK